MRGVWRFVHLLRFKTLLVLILALNIVVFITLNSFMLHEKDELDGKSPGFNFKARESKKLNFANHLAENIKDNHVRNDLEEFSDQNRAQPLLDTPLEKSTFANNRDDSDQSEERISVEEDKSLVSNNVAQNASRDEQNRLLPLKISTSSSFHRENGDKERPPETTKTSLKNSLITKRYVNPVDSKNSNAAAESRSDLRTSSLDMLKIEPSKLSLDANGNSYPHSIQNYSLTLAKNKKEEQVNKILPTTAKSLTQEDLNNIAENMQVQFKVEDIKTAEVSLRNMGISPIEGKLWCIHFCVTPGIELEHLVHRPEGYVLPSEKSIKLTHFNGCTYKLEPTRDFKAILPGNALKFVVHIGPTLAKSDLVPRWYVTADGLEPRTISNTADESLDFVVLSERKKAWDRFGNNDVADLKKAPLLVVPTPLEIVGLNESMKLYTDSEWVVLGEPGLEEETSFLAGKLQVQKSLTHTKNRKSIKLALGEVLLETPLLSKQSPGESYQLEVNVFEELIKITGTGKAGVFYGIQTLLALMDDQGLVPQVSIKDSPRFSYRGLMLDVARNFQSKGEVMKLLDLMAMYKMNKFHFHLSDNEGWRLEIPGLEELTSVGSRRCHDLQEKTCIMSQLGSGPDTSTSGTGHFSTEDYREILRHATQRHIQVIPEFDFPGHSHAAIKSMIARHNRLMQQGNEKDAKKFLLNDFKDESRYLTVQHFTDETSNCCLNSTYTLMEYILATLLNLHHDIQPLTVYHFGGDEVPGGAWKKSPACEQLAQTLKFPYNDVNTHNKLKEYFLRRLSNLTARMNIAVGGWGDFLFEPKTRSIVSREFFPNKEVYSFAWSRTGAVKNNHEVSLMASHGYKVVLSSPDYIYLDHPYEPVGEERGKYWATPYTDTRKIFNYAPEELYEDIDEIRNCSGLKMCVDGRQNILGVEAAVWSETIRTADHMYSMIFPRLLALAERAWHKAPWEGIKDRLAQDREKTGDWVNFANTLGYKELGRLDKMGVIYHVTPPGARFVGKKLETRAALPGLKVEYSADEGVTWSDVTNNMEVEGKIKLRTRSANGQRVSREVEIESPKPTPVKNKNDQDIVPAPGAERKRDEQNKGKQEGDEQTKGEEKSQEKRENSEIKEKRSDILEEKTEREDGIPEIEDESF